MTDHNQRRRSSLLASLAFAPGGAATVRELRSELETVHNIPASADLVRGDLTWLHEQGLARYGMHDDAQITERGRDVSRRTAPWPGSV